MFNGSGKPFSRDDVNNSFYRLVDAGLVEQKKTVTGIEKDTGYRLVDYKLHEDV